MSIQAQEIKYIPLPFGWSPIKLEFVNGKITDVNYMAYINDKQDWVAIIRLKKYK